MYDLTIIIPHYNTPAYLKELLESVPALPNVQVIVADDKSDKYLDEYHTLKNDDAFSFVTFIDNVTDKKNAGTCRNIGLKHAEGKWLLFADADDIFTEGFYDIAAEYFDSDCDVVYFTPTSIDRDTGQTSTRHLLFEKNVRAFHNSPTAENELWLRYEIDLPWSKMIKLELVREHNIRFSEVIASNDSAFCTKAGHYMKSFTTSEETIYCAINNVGSLTKTVNEEIYDARLNEFIWKYNFIRGNVSRKDFRTIGLCGAEYLYKVFKYGFRPGKFLNVLRMFRENKVRIISRRFMNLSNLRIKRASSKNSRRFIVRPR